MTPAPVIAIAGDAEAPPLSDASIATRLLPLFLRLFACHRR
jgi:hypothetical protein